MVVVSDAADDIGHRAVQCGLAYAPAPLSQLLATACDHSRWEPTVCRGWAEGGSEGRSLLVFIDMGVNTEREVGGLVAGEPLRHRHRHARAEESGDVAVAEGVTFPRQAVQSLCESFHACFLLLCRLERSGRWASSDRLGCRRAVAQRRVRTDRVVVPTPPLDQHAGLPGGLVEPILGDAVVSR